MNNTQTSNEPVDRETEIANAMTEILGDYREINFDDLDKAASALSQNRLDDVPYYLARALGSDFRGLGDLKLSSWLL